MENSTDTRFTRSFRVACYQSDRQCRLKTTAILDFAQDMAGDHADILGFGNEVLIKQRLVWVIARQELRMEHYPQWKDELEISTWHRGLEGPFYIRDYQIKDAGGRLLGSMTTSWLIFNLDERKIVRSEIATGESTICKDAVMDHFAGKIRLPKDLLMETCGSHLVSYSDIDKNGHANNVCYAAWALDSLDRDFVTGHPVRGYEVNFVKEAMPGQTVELRRGQAACSEGTLWYVEGYVEGHQSFIARILF